MNNPNQIKPDLSDSHRKLAGRYYYAIGAVLFLLGLALMITPHALHKEGELWKVLGEIGTFLALIVALHFIYEIVVKKEERQLFINDLNNVLEHHINEVNRTLQLSRAKIYSGQEETYAVAADTIARVSRTQLGEKSIIIAALHGHSGKRRTMRQETKSAFESFAEQMHKCIQSSGAGMWYVREIYNITDEDRLNMVLQRIEKAENAEGYEVRAFCLQNVLPQYSPLVIGNQDFFLGLDDPTYYGAKGAIHITGQDFATSATEYFESLWNDKRLFILRSNLGIENAQINSLRAALAALNGNVIEKATPKTRKKNTITEINPTNK